MNSQERQEAIDKHEADEAREQITNISVEHMLGMTNGPLVKLYIDTEDGTKALGRISPKSARDIALHIIECAARAEYEADLEFSMIKAEWSDEMKAGIIQMVRRGEENRHTNPDPRTFGNTISKTDEGTTGGDNE